ncbi:uncharacterized protein LOC116298089 [Actinia tenebrosa]|uniref:Uncharacterized protein LOC116298089 n=1 Tax=Actinia tenebrosa TaxID=6105 RepID=A0A6P8I3D3_ACTTE|nr:uncharacterized protein LOC116298089 [Actinia tenebrosa]
MAAANVVLGHYEVNWQDKLGQGGFGIVFRGTDTRRGIEVAVKQMELKKDKIGSDAMTEIKNLQKLPSHPHIVKFFDSFFQANSFWMVMEFCNFGNLKQYFDKYKPIDFVTKVEFMQQAASAIRHLHGLPVPIIHRDLKPANIMLHYTGDKPVIKVTDFGLAKVAEDKEEKADMANSYMMSTFAGTPVFMAPEFFMEQMYTSSVDVFALGLVYLGMLNYDKIGDILPLSDFKMPLGMVIAHALQTGSSPPKLVEIKPSDSKETKEVKEVIEKMLMAKKEDRMKIQEVSTALNNIFDKRKDRLPGYPLLRQAGGQKLELSTGSMATPQIRSLPTSLTMENKAHNIRKIDVGSKTIWSSPGKEKILMLVGATGAGKSTLINGLVNYIMGVRYEDDHRYKLIGDEGSGSQAHIQTKWITAYTIHKQDNQGKLPFTLTIIDTPGFGDTEGLQRDRKITNQIREFFSLKGPQGIDHLDGIGFVVKAPEARLTPTQRYIFDSILGMFGKDIGQNIFIMVTFAYGNKAPVLAAIKEAKFEFQKSFKFNNSALFSEVEKEDKEEEDEDEDEEASNNMTFNSMYWKMGEKSYKDFFRTFGKAQSVSLQLIRELLEEREHLEHVIQRLQQNIRAGLDKADELRQAERVIKVHEKDMLINKDFRYKADVTKQRKVDLPRGEYVTNCLRCQMTCHYPCGIPRDEDKAGCAAMGSNGQCNICPEKCYWNNHVNNAYRFELYQETETITSEELKNRYYEAASKKTATEKVIAGLKEDLQNLYLTVFGMLRQANSIIRRLEEISLRPNPLSEIQYIDLLIESERLECKPNFQQRISALNDVRKEAKILAEIKDERKILKDAAQYCWQKLKIL